MAEYLSPGVYVEEFESGAQPMEGVGTSTAGFIGLAEKGPVRGLPQLVTNFSDFKRNYGGYLSENEFGDYHFLAYAVEAFFVNGGSRCFVSRVAPADAKSAVGTAPSAQNAVLTFTAKNPGLWGNDILVSISPASKAKTQVLEIIESSDGAKYRVKSGVGFHIGDVISFEDKGEVIYTKVTKNQDNILSLEDALPKTVVDTQLLPSKVITTNEINIEVKYKDVVESYDNVSFNVNTFHYIEKKLAKSDLVVVEYKEPKKAGAVATPAEPADKDAKLAKKDDAPKAPVQVQAGKKVGVVAPFDVLEKVAQVVFDGGSNGTLDAISAEDFIGEDGGAGARTGIQSFIDNDVVSIMAVPGVTDPNVQLTLVAHCENLASRFAVLDVPRGAKKVADVIAHRDIFDSDYAALYHPWLLVFDPLDKKNIAVPPSGAILGVYARSDNTRGVQKAPANEMVRSCVGLDCQFNTGEQDILNPKGINLIRAFAGQGIRVWGARTLSSNPSWKYVNVRRLFIFVEESIKANTNWAVFEPNNEVLWVRVQRTISVFLTNLWRGGSLAGTTPDEAYFVNIGRDTMSQDDIDNGRLICVIGIAPVKPAEFVIFRITQKTNDSAE
ncbi:phage tail sheath family protein [Lachnospiraceae bacterium ZAX-1]